MNNSFPLIVLALGFLSVAAYLLFPIKRSPPGTKEAVSKPSTASPDRDKRMIERGQCPDCGESDLLSGPSGGMSLNVGCNNCLMEFNVHHHFGGVLGVDRTGKMSEGRAQVFGIQADEYQTITAKS